jgi:hypothetical protein
MSRESRPIGEAAPEDPAADHHQRNGFHLRAELESLGGSLKQSTVMSDQSDPFRMDTPANHRDGEWLARTMLRLSITQQIHDRGIHYAILGQPKPMGSIYTNIVPDWEWLQDVVKVARWLGYVSYEQILDQRNDAPEIRMWTPPYPSPSVSVDFDVWIPDVDDLAPRAMIDGFTGSQPYHLVLIGEKSSLRTGCRQLPGRSVPARRRPVRHHVLPDGPLGFRRRPADGGALLQRRRSLGLAHADCVRPQTAGVPGVVLPRAGLPGSRVGLTPDQVREYGLPSTPLKESERRADRWREAMGVEQTEIDALATLRPDLLRQIARDAIAPFFDSSLEDRFRDARQEWLAAAQARIEEQDGGVSAR